MYCDAHIHLIDLIEKDPGFPERFAGHPLASGGADCLQNGRCGSEAAPAFFACAASHAKDEYLATEALRGQGLAMVTSFGMHPQWPVWDYADYLAELAGAGRIAAIGEAGFDFFGDRPERIRNDENLRIQRAAFEYQLGLAEKTGLPLLMHLRKAGDLLFSYAGRLAKLSAVVLHSCPCTAGETEALLRRGVNAYFSFGAAVLNGHKNAIAAAASVPAERLLSETDAPWQPPRGSHAGYCRFEDIAAVVEGLARIRTLPAAVLTRQIEENFRRVYRV